MKRKSSVKKAAPINNSLANPGWWYIRHLLVWFGVCTLLIGALILVMIKPMYVDFFWIVRSWKVLWHV